MDQTVADSSEHRWTLTGRIDSRVALGRANIAIHALRYVHPTLGAVIGSSANIDGSESKARYELLERIWLVEHLLKSPRRTYVVRSADTGEELYTLQRSAVFPSSRPGFRIVESNGVALHKTWAQACRAAALELLERHLVLESYKGWIKPRLLDPGQSLYCDLGLDETYRTSTYSLGSQATDAFASPIFAAVSLLCPVDASKTHQITAFGAGFSEREAALKAEQEALQRYGFLNGTPIPHDLAYTPTSSFHQSYHLMPAHHGLVQSWLAGEFFRGLADGSSAASPSVSVSVSVSASDAESVSMPAPIRLRFVDLTLASELDFFLVKAISDDISPLEWGVEAMDDLSAAFVHPIP
jgi:hypothetical protein